MDECRTIKTHSSYQPLINHNLNANALLSKNAAHFSISDTYTTFRSSGGNMQKINLAALLTLAAMGSVPAEAQIVATKIDNASLVLPANTLVYVSLNSNLTSKRTAEGELFDVTVTRPIIVGDYIVIPAGTLGHGRITWRTGKAVFGKSAKMHFEFTDLQIGNQTIPLTGRYRIEGKGNTGWTLGAIAAAGLAGGLFVTGHSATAFQGTEYKAFTAGPTMVSLAAPGTPAYYASGGYVPVNVGPNNGKAPFESGRQLAQAQMAAAGMHDASAGFPPR